MKKMPAGSYMIQFIDVAAHKAAKKHHLTQQLSDASEAFTA